MKKYTVAYVIGSLSSTSINRAYAEALIALAPDQIEFKEVSIKDVPLYCQDDDNDKDFPASVKKVKKEVEAADAIVFFTPEYNRSFPGVLKNAIDYASRPWGHNSWNGKPAAVISVAGSPQGGATANNALKAALSYSDMPIMSQPEMYVPFTGETVADGKFADLASKEFAHAWMKSFATFLEKHAA